MRLALLEYNIGLFAFGIFAEIIIGLFLVLILRVSKNNERNNKNAFRRNRSYNTNISSASRNNRCLDRYNKRLSTEEIIEDLIICDILGLL